MDSARELIDRLSELDRPAPGAADRHERLLELESRAESALRELAAIYGPAAQPMESHERDALALARALALALARGWKSQATQSKAKVAVPVIKAMSYLADAMRASYETYSKVPDGTWRAFRVPPCRATRAP